MKIVLVGADECNEHFFNFTISTLLGQCGMKVMGNLTFNADQNACNSFVQLLLEIMKDGDTIRTMNNYKVCYYNDDNNGETVEETIEMMSTGQFVMSDIINQSHYGPFALYILTRDKYKSNWIPPVYYSKNPNYDNTHYVCVFGLSATKIDRQKANTYEEAEAKVLRLL